jgi:hypothetical protein
MLHQFTFILCTITFIDIFGIIISTQKNAHSVGTGPSSSRLTPPSLFLLHVASFLAERLLLVSPVFLGAGPSLTPPP